MRIESGFYSHTILLHEKCVTFRVELFELLVPKLSSVLNCGVLLCLLLAAITANAQHSQQTSQYMINGLAINPAYAGSKDAFSATAIYRSQWTGIDGAPRSQNLSFHGPLKNKKIALGLMLFHDALGVTSENGIFLNYAYRLPLQGGQLSMGLAGGVSFLRSNWTEATVIETSDIAFSSNSPLYVLPNFSTGIRYEHKDYFVGFSIPMPLTHQLTSGGTSPATAIRPKEFKYFIHAGYYYQINEQWMVSPSALVKILPSVGSQIDINAIVEYNELIGLGMSYRSNDAVVAMAQFRINKQFTVGYSYDFTTSQLSNYTNGSHEISLRYDLNYKVKVANPRFF